MAQHCCLELSDGTRLDGYLIGAPLVSSGELVFTTAMVGYTETCTDPSYYGQMIVFAYPLIGNYGVPKNKPGEELSHGFESAKIHGSGVVISESCSEAYHWDSFRAFDNWLREMETPGIVGVDTRTLIHKITAGGSILARIVPASPTGVRKMSAHLQWKSSSFFDPNQHCLLPEVSTSTRRRFGNGSSRVALIDCGVKWNIVRSLQQAGCEVELIPWDEDFNDVDCDGWLLSNGPGDPKNTGKLKDKVALLLKGPRPILGICLGIQIMTLAAGGQTIRMPYGHRSHNQPVYDVRTRQCFLTSQNHSYAVDAHSLPEDWDIWFRNANDESVEGIRHRSGRFLAVQFHPEASGGPHDTSWIISDFVQGLRKK